MMTSYPFPSPLFIQSSYSPFKSLTILDKLTSQLRGRDGVLLVVNTYSTTNSLNHCFPATPVCVETTNFYPPLFSPSFLANVKITNLH